MFEKEIRYTDTGERIKPGDKVIIEFVYPEKLNYVGRTDKVLKQIIEENNGTIKKK
ncbi:hypothetical protein [Macrococcus psychrotolerans]|uniref:Uncharacterized protein n=1 Tax=Macrococcus psychrotolerans TaxID=3039389 RepID=A0AAU6RK33_9STAP|nr:MULTISPECIES: hypothetical protein [Macrococcus]QYA32533.1 hypothetical protein KYI10_09325 [Macrococcus sp. 19Msa1099]QYA37343.1 hypothetical protein KYI07_09315 [Macrococcus caseolyticus]QYA76050.1 hypothetical protein KYI12_09315 [Macrococcus caseolyticus]